MYTELYLLDVYLGTQFRDMLTYKMNLKNKNVINFTCLRRPDCDGFQIVLSISATIVCSSISVTKPRITETPSSPTPSCVPGPSPLRSRCVHFWSACNVRPQQIQNVYCRICLLRSSSKAFIDTHLNLSLSSQSKHLRIPVQPHSDCTAAAILENQQQLYVRQVFLTTIVIGQISYHPIKCAITTQNLPKGACHLWYTHTRVDILQVFTSNALSAMWWLLLYVLSVFFANILRRAWCPPVYRLP